MRKIYFWHVRPYLGIEKIHTKCAAAQSSPFDGEHQANCRAVDRLDLLMSEGQVVVIGRFVEYTIPSVAKKRDTPLRCKVKTIAHTGPAESWPTYWNRSQLSCVS